MTIKLCVQLTLPRRVARQIHRNSVPAKNPKKNFNRSLAIPLLEDFIYGLEFRFNDLSVRLSKLFFHVPAVIRKMENPVLSAFSGFYGENLGTKDVLDLEIKLWKQVWSSVPANQHSSTLATSIKVFHETRFPDLFKRLQIVCTLPVTSCECEINFSFIRILRT